MQDREDTISKKVDIKKNISFFTVTRYIDQNGTNLTNSQQRRIIKELRDIMCNPHKSIKVYPSQTK